MLRGRRSATRGQMRRRVLVTIFAGMVLSPPSAAAERAVMIIVVQVGCDSMPAGPARTDCYIGLSRISRQDSEIAAGAAQRSKDIARYHQVTGQQRNAKPHATKRKW